MKTLGWISLVLFALLPLSVWSEESDGTVWTRNSETTGPNGRGVTSDGAVSVTRGESSVIISGNKAITTKQGKTYSYQGEQSIAWKPGEGLTRLGSRRLLTPRSEGQVTKTIRTARTGPVGGARSVARKGSFRRR